MDPKVLRTKKITRPLPPRQEYMLLDPMAEGATEMSQTAIRQTIPRMPDLEMERIQRMPLFRPLGGPSPSISVTPPIPMRAAPMSVR
jgi:hypothetical protein